MRSLLKAGVLLFVCAGSISAQIAASGSGRALVAGGEYTVGTDSSEIAALMERYTVRSAQLFTSETPRRQRMLRAFEIDRFEVTNRAFAEFVEARPEWSRERLRAELHDGDYLAHWDGAAPPDRLREVPVTNITWHAAAAFCGWMEMRLPTEVEWEVAARGGLTGEVFPWGTSLPDSTNANWSRSGLEVPIRGGSYPPNGFGIFDMAGNVWEMTSTPWSDHHPEQAESGDSASIEPPQRIDPEERRVIRGGSYGAAPVNMRVRYRDSHRVADAGPHVGFRCARTVG